MPETANLKITDQDLLVIGLEKESAFDFRKRRHIDWRDNYTLYRDKVIPNRLTQRQSVNVPLMKYALGSLMKELDDPPALYFKNLDNNEQKEVYFNESWKETAKQNKLRIKDITDKKQAMLYGRTFKKLNIIDGKFTFEVIDPQDMLVQRFVDPSDLDTAKILIQTDIYRTLNDIVKNPDYSKKGKKALSIYYAEQNETLEQDETFNKVVEKNQRMTDMGLEDANDPKLGETYVELNEVYRKEFSEAEDQEIIFLYVVATPGGAVIELQKQKLYEVIGDTADNFWYDHFPFNSWATDPERTDFWSDAPADIIRGSNQVANAFYSQLVENRTLRNYNMHYYDSTVPDFVPQTYTPEPWGWYPLPGKPSDVMTTVEVPDLSESLDELQFIIELAEKAVGSTSTQAGSVEDRERTLGEVQLALANAQERVKSIAIYYTEAWKDFGLKYIRMLEASSDKLDPITITKEGRLGRKMYQKTISPKQYATKSGYIVEVSLLGEKQEADLDNLQKLDASLRAMPYNTALRRIYNRKLLEFARLSVEQIQQVEEFETQNPTPVVTEEEGGSRTKEDEGEGIPDVPIATGGEGA